jgi:hypothetical protein
MTIIQAYAYIPLSNCNFTKQVIGHFHSRTVHLDIIKVFTTTDAQVFLRGVLKFTLKQLQHVSMLSPSSESALFELAKITFIKTAAPFGTILVPNGAADIHKQGPDNICSHTTILTTIVYFN